MSIKLIQFQTQNSKTAAFVIEAEEAEIQELLKRIVMGEILRAVSAVSAAAPAPTAAPAAAKPAAAAPAAPALKPAAAAPAAAPAAKKEKTAPAPKPAPAAPPPAAEDEDLDAPADEEEGGGDIPAEVLAAEKLREVVQALQQKLGLATKDQIIAWCTEHQAQVPALERLKDVMVDRVTRACGLLAIE
jgi:hypothetical protein